MPDQSSVPSYKTSTLSQMAYITLLAYLASLLGMLAAGLYYKLEPLVNQANDKLEKVFIGVVIAYIARYQIQRMNGKPLTEEPKNPGGNV